MARLLVNPRSKVIFAGFESDTYSLGQMGWEISVQEDLEYGRFEAMFHHQGANLILHAISKEHPMREHQYRATVGMNARQAYEATYLGNVREFDGPTFNVVRAFAFRPDLKVYHNMSVFHDWSETRPALLELDHRSYNPFDFPIFTKKGEPAPKELIVEPQDVMQLLEQIKLMQSPEQATIRERRRKDVPVAHATILSFSEAA